MRSRMDSSTEAGYGYVAGCLNTGYIAGFLRRRQVSAKGATFAVQQSNNVEHGLPVEVTERASIPPERDPIKVIGHFYGERLPSGERIAKFKAITLDRPSLREMPNHAAWFNDSAPEGTEAAADDFQPFFDPSDDEEVSSIFYKGDKKRGRPCLNVARLAGFIDAYGFARRADGSLNRSCLVIALRQTKNADEAIPIRLYGRFTEAFMKNISVAKPVFVEGFYRVRFAVTGTKEDGSEIREALPYIWCNNIKVATPREIVVQPDWWRELLAKRMADMKARADEAAAAVQAVDPAKDIPVDPSLA